MISGRGVFFAAILCAPFASPGVSPGTPASWIPARWEGGPLEVARRAQAGSLPPGPAAREAIENWYDPETLRLLDGSPINCLLVTWSAGGAAGIEQRQRQLVRAYAAEAHKRGVAVLGLVYPGAGARQAPEEAETAGLDGLALDGDFAAYAGSLPAIRIWRDTASASAAKGPVVAIRGTSPGARNLADMGIRAAPSSEPWIESNIWLVRFLRAGSPARAVWIDQQPEGSSPEDYTRSVADAAVAGGRWIVALDDGIRAGLRRNDPAALAVWRRIGTAVGFAERHAEWRAFQPYGNLGIVVDPAVDEEEYLKLAARRQAPYRLIPRAELRDDSLRAFRAVLAAGLTPLSAAERDFLKVFAQRGGVVIAGPSWGNPPKEESYAEFPTGKGRIVVYADPDPESVARDLKDLLSQEEMGVVAFNVPSVITYAAAEPGGRLLVQLLNYSNTPAQAITIRVHGAFRTARLYMPGAEPSDLPLKAEAGRIDVSIPKLPFWGAVLLE